jgi:hypothetical protein
MMVPYVDPGPAIGFCHRHDRRGRYGFLRLEGPFDLLEADAVPFV